MKRRLQSFKPLIAFMKGENTAIGIQLAHGGRKSSSQRAMDGMGPLTPEQIKAGAKAVAAGGADQRAGCGWMADPAPAHHRRVPGDGRHLGQGRP